MINSSEYEWDDEIIGDLTAQDFAGVKVYSRDWTIQTIVSQIRDGNIDLDPKFQRRNAWTDERRSALIESLIVGIPVPQIVLAELPNASKKFVVLDGKQRLLALAGFYDPSRQSWNRPKLRSLTLREDLNGYGYSDMGATLLEDTKTLLDNADIRCVILSNYNTDDVLFHIFYRLNTGSVALSTQELRQALAKGPMSAFLIKTTDEPHPIHQYLGLSEPDPRFRDVELLLRFTGFRMFPEKYSGNLKKFLDLTLHNCNHNWDGLETQIKQLDQSLASACALLNEMFGDPELVGSKYTGEKWERRFNKALFDVELVYAHELLKHKQSKAKLTSFAKAFEKLCSRDESFVRSVEVTTKTVEQYYTRFSIYEKLVNKHFATNIRYAKVFKRQ